MDFTMDMSKFYAGRSLFLTGVTGFMGKVLLEKILRSCPDVSKIYVLIRPKKSLLPHERLASIFDSPLFAKVIKENANCKDKVISVSGDVLQPHMGISEEDNSHIQEDVSIVFHCAASVRFQEPFRDAIESNVRSVDRVIELSKKMRKFEVLVHLSTAFAYCYRKHIEEKFYPINVNPKDLLNCSRWMSTEMMEKLAPSLLGDHPNTYTYTKSVAENLLLHHGIEHRTVIVRPSIVTSSWKEPMAGWCDSMNGPVGLVITFGKGLLRTMLGKRSAAANFVPVDVPINLMLAGAWKNVTQRNYESEPTIYNCTNPDSNRFLWGDLSDLLAYNAKLLPLDKPARIPLYGSSISPNRLRNKLEWIFCHWIPAYTVDGILRIARKRPKFVRWYKKINSMCDCLNYFTVRSWKWENNNKQDLQKIMSDKDKETFYFDTSTLDWNKYIEDYHMGVKRYILHEKMEELPNTRKWIQRRQTISKILKGLLLFLILYSLLQYDFVSQSNVLIACLFLFVHSAISYWMDPGQQPISKLR
uniref:fatty acyl-CoA reductase 1-like n=1 Tax=Styela clava TaxID=7725 RepID=UPI00193A43F1|nr:fatty acyl-CoA reductase 1-like [Styela clava]